MSYRSLRRRLSEATAAHDWLEGLSTLMGMLFLVLAAGCVWAFVVTISTLGDPDAAFDSTPGFLQGIRGFGIVFFAGDAIRRVWRRVRGRA